MRRDLYHKGYKDMSPIDILETLCQPQPDPSVTGETNCLLKNLPLAKEMPTTINLFMRSLYGWDYVIRSF